MLSKIRVNSLFLDDWGQLRTPSISLVRGQTVGKSRVSSTGSTKGCGTIDKEGATMPRKNVSREALHRAALRSAKASAELERRSVPTGFVRSVKVERFLAARRQSA
jgi:hypothetical protein